MRDSLIANISATSSKVTVNPVAVAANAGLAASQSLKPVEQERAEGVLASERGISAPDKRTEGIFDASPTESEEERVKNNPSPDQRRLINVA
jgi:hypothetical protein